MADPNRPYFRTVRRALGPSWLVAGEGGDVGYSLDIVKDAFADRIFSGLLARFPQNDPDGTPAPPDALTAQGRDRRVQRGLLDTDATYAVKLIQWLEDRKTAGNPFTLLKKVAEYLGDPRPSFRTVDVNGNWFSRAADGTQSYRIKAANFDWDGAIGARWSRFWLIIYPNGFWTDGSALGFNWGNVAGPSWGDAARGTWGSTATADHIATIRSIVADWKVAGTRCVNIVIAFDATSFDPSGPLHGAGLPDGLWLNWSKTVAGVQVPARLATARYCDGV